METGSGFIALLLSVGLVSPTAFPFLSHKGTINVPIFEAKSQLASPHKRVIRGKGTKKSQSSPNWSHFRAASAQGLLICGYLNRPLSEV